jgi:hypothetical protein
VSACPIRSSRKRAPPPQERTQKKARKQKKHRKAPAARTPRTARPTAERFVPTVDAEKRLHIINGGAPISFDDSQTEAIASLLLQHYA